MSSVGLPNFTWSPLTCTWIFWWTVLGSTGSPPSFPQYYTKSHGWALRCRLFYSVMDNPVGLATAPCTVPPPPTPRTVVSALDSPSHFSFILICFLPWIACSGYRQSRRLVTMVKHWQWDFSSFSRTLVFFLNSWVPMQSERAGTYVTVCPKLIMIY